MYVPSHAFVEAKSTIKKKDQSKDVNFIGGARELFRHHKGHMTMEQTAAVDAFLSRFEQELRKHLLALENNLENFWMELGNRVIFFDGKAADKVLEIRKAWEKDLKPFDESILACALAKAEEIHKTSPSDKVYFISKDQKDLSCYDKNNGKFIPQREQLYNKYGIIFLSDFSLAGP